MTKNQLSHKQDIEISTVNILPKIKIHETEKDTGGKGEKKLIDGKRILLRGILRCVTTSA